MIGIQGAADEAVLLRYLPGRCVIKVPYASSTPSLRGEDRNLRLSTTGMMRVAGFLHTTNHSRLRASTAA